MSTPKKIKTVIRDAYTKIAQASEGCGCNLDCHPNQNTQRQTKQIGYSQEEISQAPAGANLGLGCGNPVAIASLRKGEIVLDLGSGAGFDAFLASKKVGSKGKVIGVDMTPKMVEKAKENATKGGFANVEFREGDIESLPVDNDSVNVVISNCVINLAPNKRKVFTEIYRVLKPGGRLMVADTMLLKPLPVKLRGDEKLLTGCVGGAMLKSSYLDLLRKSGFSNIIIHQKKQGFLKGYSLSVTYSAIK